jgi:uncharacterized protein
MSRLRHSTLPLAAAFMLIACGSQTSTAPSSNEAPTSSETARTSAFATTAPTAPPTTTSSTPPSTAPVASKPTPATTPVDFTWPAAVKRQPTTFTFRDGWVANAEIDYPTTGTGPFPTVILLHGSGANDMDQTIPGPPGDSKVFRQLGATLASNGFAVVRYNKRGVLDIGPEPDPNESTFTLTQYIQDATDVLNIAKTLPEVDAARVVLLGHSEGTLTASAIAQSTDGDDLAALVLVGVVGFDIKSTLRYQLIDSTIDSIASEAQFADGLIDPASAIEILGQGGEAALEASAKIFGLIKDPTAPSGYRFDPALDLDGDGNANIETELRVFLRQNYDKAFPNLPEFGFTERDAQWLADTQTYGTVGSLLQGNTTPVLMMNGDNDIQTLVAGARATFDQLQSDGQSAIELKTYRGLGHSLYPAEGLDQPLGPFEPEPLSDLVDWLTARVGS